MFFNKINPSAAVSNLNIAIIGTSPLALLIADILLSQGYQTTLLVSQNKLASYTKLNPFTVKTSSFQSHRIDFPFASTLTAPADYCFLASSPESNRTDLLLLQDAFLKNTPIINLSAFYNRQFLKDLKKDSFNGWFGGWLNLEKNTLQLLERNPKLEINCPQDIAANLAPLFNKNTFNLSFCCSKADLFWPQLLPFFLGNLLLLASNQTISSALNQPTYRQLVDNAIKEIALITPSLKNKLNLSDVLPQIYAIPDNYKSEFTSPVAFNLLSSLIKGITPFTTPHLNQLLTSAAKNIRV